MWIAVVLVVLLVLLAVFGVLKTRGEMPPTDYKNLFTIGIIFVGSGLPLWLTTETPALFFTGLAFMAVAMFNRDKWDENAEANKWENLTDEQRATKRRVTRTLLALVILGVVAFAVVAVIAAA